MRSSRRAALALGALGALGACSLLAEGAPRPPDPASRTPERYRRPADQTFLTYPEWFLVFSPEEYADHVASRPPSAFPFLTHVAQLWHGYAVVAAAVPAGEPFNAGYHGMVLVISTSTTVEYGVRSVYETLIGRLAEASALGARSTEDAYAAEVARDYEQFLRQRAWYDFDYAGALARLWTEVPFDRAHPLRALERRYALSSEYLFKLGYAQLLRSASSATFDDFAEVTAVVLEGLPPDPPPGLEVRERFEDGAVLATLPRYAAFGPAASALAAGGARFLEIAGNAGPILLSVRAPRGAELPGRVLLRQPLATDEARERALLAVEVPELAGALRAIAAPPLALEHVYDF